MQLIALKPIRVKTSKGNVEIRQGDTFSPVKSEMFIKKGVAVQVTSEHFRVEFLNLANHLKQQFTSKNMTRLQELVIQMDEAWEAVYYPAFKKTIDAMLQIEGIEVTVTPEDVGYRTDNEDSKSVNLLSVKG